MGRRARWTASAVVLSFLCGALPAAAGASLTRGELRRGLAHQMHRVGGSSGAWVIDLGAPGRRGLFSHASHGSRILASNTKLFTTAAVLGRFGSEAKLATKVWARGQRAGEDGRILRGSLALVGAGDPALASEGFARSHNLPLTRMRSLAGDVARAGVDVVRGGIIADETAFDRLRSVPQTGISGGPFLTPLSGLSYDSGTVGGRPASSPALVAGRALKRGLEAEGVRVQDDVRVADSPNRLRRRPPLGLAESPSIATLIERTNEPSNNFFAEMLLKRLAAHPDGGGTTARGARLAERFARRAGSGVRMENGSGLSRADRASPRQVGRLLITMSRRHGGPAFRESLAAVGREGTLDDRMEGTAAAGRCMGKTGSLTAVSALSGYCRSGHGLVVFSILMNGVDVNLARDAQDEMVPLIARYRR